MRDLHLPAPGGVLVENDAIDAKDVSAQERLQVRQGARAAAINVVGLVLRFCISSSERLGPLGGTAK